MENAQVNDVNILAEILQTGGDLATVVIAVGIWQVRSILKRIEGLERRVLLLELSRGTIEDDVARKAIMDGIKNN